MNLRNHLGWGFGTFLAGILIQPFISHKKNDFGQNWKISDICLKQLAKENRSFYYSQKNPLKNASILSNQTDSSEERIEYAFTISGCIIFASMLVLLFLHFLPKPPAMIAADSNKKSNIKLMELNAIEKPSLINRVFKIDLNDVNPKLFTVMIILLILFYFLLEFSIDIQMTLINVIAMDPCKSFIMSPSKAAILVGAGQAIILGNRVLSSFYANFCTELMILVHIIGASGSVIFLYIFGNQYEVALWITYIVFCFFNAPFFPSGTSWVNNYVKLTPGLISLALIGGTVGMTITSSLSGTILNKYGSMKIFWFSLIGYPFFILDILAIIFIGRKIKNSRKSLTG